MGEFVSYNPATGEPAGAFCATTAAQVDCVLFLARSAARHWAETPIRERCALLNELRLSLADEADTLAETIHREIGKPLQEAYGADILPSLKSLQWLTKNAPKALRPRPIPGRRSWQEAVPLGVVGVIGTWNYPVFLNLTSIAWALAAGNAVVWKPSELATASAMQLAAHFEQVGLPVFTIPGESETGRALCDAGCDKIAFTGGRETGRKILAQLAKHGTPSVMELSGSDAMIVCADADVETAARSAVWGRCCNAGQNCVAPQRVYVAAPVYESFLEECRKVIAALRPGVDFGPMRTDALREQAHCFVWEAVSRGARLLIGGQKQGVALEDRQGTSPRQGTNPCPTGKPEDFQGNVCAREHSGQAGTMDTQKRRAGREACPTAGGYFYVPTLLADCHQEMLLFERDFFGPVVAVCPFESESEAVQYANDNEMALAASLWTRDLRRARRLASQLKAGLVSINEILLDAADAALPFGGMRGSGFGKQRGEAGLDEFVTWKTIAPHRAGGTRRHLFPYVAATLPILRGMIGLQAARTLREKWQAARSLAQAAMQYKNDEKDSGREP